jgi:hypothetical protein
MGAASINPDAATFDQLNEADDLRAARNRAGAEKYMMLVFPITKAGS